MKRRFEDRVVMITGAGRGQGRAHALSFAAEGARIVACDIDRQLATVEYRMNQANELDETVSMVEQLGSEALAVRADVRSAEDMARAAAAGVERFGSIDVLCANAGIGTGALIEAISSEQWQDNIDVNLTGTFNSVRAVVRYMIERHYGRIIAIASTTVRRPPPASSAYVSSKSGVLGLVNCLSIELGRHNITVNAVSPGVIATGMSRNEAFNRSLRPDLPDPTAEDADVVLRTLNRLGTGAAPPEAVSSAVLFLASDDARYVTGTTIDVNPVI